MRTVICNYCDKPAELVTGTKIYPHIPSLHPFVYWNCDPCKAYVGCHKKSDAAPLGRLANLELRKAKMAVHAAFDPLWKDGKIKRKEAYQLLADRMGIDVNKCHVGMFTIEQCNLALRVVRDLE